MIGTLYNFLQIGGTFPKMVPLLLPNFGSSLKWYQFVCDFLYFSPIVPFLLQNFAVFPNSTFSVGIFYVQIGAKFSQMVPFLLVNFYNFLK